MTAQQMKRKLLEIRVAQQKYALAVETAEQFEKIGGRGKQAEKYRLSCAVLEKDMLAARELAEMYIGLLESQAEKEIVTRRYVFCENWEMIADNMNYSMRQVIRIHDRALKKMSLNVKLDL